MSQKSLPTAEEKNLASFPVLKGPSQRPSASLVTTPSLGAAQGSTKLAAARRVVHGVVSNQGLALLYATS